MALDNLIHYRTFLRNDSLYKAPRDLLLYLYEHCRVGFNYDGDLWGLGIYAERLEKFGFSFPEDFITNDISGREQVDWLDYYTIIPHSKDFSPINAIAIAQGNSKFVQCQRTDLFYVKDVNSTWRFEGKVEG